GWDTTFPEIGAFLTPGRPPERHSSGGGAFLSTAGLARPSSFPSRAVRLVDFDPDHHELKGKVLGGSLLGVPLCVAASLSQVVVRRGVRITELSHLRVPGIKLHDHVPDPGFGWRELFDSHSGPPSDRHVLTSQPLPRTTRSRPAGGRHTHYQLPRQPNAT